METSSYARRDLYRAKPAVTHWLVFRISFKGKLHAGAFYDIEKGHGGQFLPGTPQKLQIPTWPVIL